MLARLHSIVLNHQHWDDTVGCCEALRHSTFDRQWLTVVDNGSDAPPSRAQREVLVGVARVDTGDNLGYAAGNNRGIELALERGADAVLLVNPDLRVEPDTIERMVAVLRDHPDVGIVGPRVRNGGSRPATIWFDGATVDLDGAGASAHVNSGVEFHRVADDVGIVDTDYVTGAAMLVRREVFDDVGLLPERYFLYFEETDFNVRAHRRGWRLLVDPTARVVHYQRSYERVPTPRYVYYYVRNRIVFGRRFSELSPEELEASARRWADGWRSRIAERAPAWLDTFDHLVDTAVADAHQDRTGRRADIEDVPHAEAAA